MLPKSNPDNSLHKIYYQNQEVENEPSPLLAYWHVTGAQPCARLAFYSPNPIGGPSLRPPMIIHPAGLMTDPARTPIITCGSCNRPVNREDLEARSLPEPVLVFRDRRADTDRRTVRHGGRRATDVDFAQPTGPSFVAPSQIAKAIGASVQFIRNEIHAGEIHNAHQLGGRGDWRIPYADARAYVQRMTHHTSAAAR